MKYIALENPVAAVEAAIRDPIGAAPLWEIVEPGQTVAFVVCDPGRTANTHVFLPVLIDEIHAVGAPYEDMCVVFATGSQFVMTKDEMVREVGEELASKVNLYNGEQNFYEDKRVEAARHIILTGSVAREKEKMAVDNRIENIITRRPSFLLNVVLNEEHQILKVFAGNYILAHREACSFADEVYEASVSESSG